MFCVLFAHVANDQRGVIEFSSVTSFFKYVIDCFYSHMWRKDHNEPIHQSIREYSKLNRLAFDGLTGNAQNIAWPKHTFIDTVGKDCYEELSYIGILIVEKTNEIINEPEEYDIHHNKQNEFVRFYHKIFAEWYAARYLSSYAGRFWPFWLKHKLNKINAVDLQFVFRFACGLNKKASSRIIKYLKSVEGGASFASLCLFEQPDNPEEVVETVKGLCSDGMIIRSSESRLLQRSNIQLLEIASRKKIEVPCLQLDHCFKLAQQNGIALESGLSVPVLLSIKKLVFTTLAEHEIFQENMLGVVKYAQRCLKLKTLAFHGKFVLPLSLTMETLKSDMNSRSITVFWQLLEYVFQLDVSSGKWRLNSTESLTSGIVETEEDVEMLRSVCSGGMALRRTDSRLLQRANIQFLEIASRHKKKCKSERKKESNSHKKKSSGYFVMHNNVHNCRQSLLWKPREQEFDLNFTRGRWTLVSQETLTLETKDQHSLTKMCSGTVTLHTNDTNEYHRSVILLLQIAASQQIQITSLMLKSFSSADENHLILESKNRVPLLPTLKELQIKTKFGKEFTQDQVIGIFCYANKCQRLKKVSFIDCVLPLSLPVGSLSPLTKLRDIEVSWKPSKPDLHLDSSRGKWVLNSKEGITLQTIFLV
ncbi:hypothetical protein BSL78_04243 [Apostichopus japonicus]|uniref:Uncharacterized protein n=1 Tax=Stichopus japonicus TaxID=307972 RepID=A0A2G8LF06_STIJA|nr:hypothetical protein BSL78_04243 [Apostichopus japonicus]